MGRSSPTVYDIAYRAGVSQATVSRVLTGHAKVSDEKRAAVMAAIAAFDYKPNVMAQGLARGRTRAIGVLTMTTESPYWGRLLRGIEQSLMGTGYRPLVASVAGLGNPDEALDMLLESQIEGLILLGGPMPEKTTQLVGENFPVAGTGPVTPGLEPYFIQSDNTEGARLATQHLLDLGHRRIALVTGPANHSHALARRRGYELALSSAGVTIDETIIVHHGFNEQKGAEATQILLDRTRDFTAIFTTSDQVAYGVGMYLWQQGIRVPQDVSIVGFDDQDHARFTTPPLTTIRVPLLEMGEALGKMIVSRIDEDGVPWSPGEFATSLVVRQSSAAPR
jgi:LacI family transcriptional regulator